MYQYPNYLMHHGVKGMKWGVRRQQKKAYKQASRARKKDMRNASKNRRQLSDQELDARINRLKKEKQLKELTNEELNPGRAIVNSQLKKVGATAIVGGAAYLAKYAITGKGSVQEAANWVIQNPNKKK